MKRFAVLLLTLAMAFCCAAPAFAAGTIEVTEDVSVSDDYDWTRFQGQMCIRDRYLPWQIRHLPH